MENKVIKKDNGIEVEFIDLTYEGLGVAKHDGFVIFVEGALPEERGTVRITKVGKRYAYGKLINLEVKSSSRMEVDNKALDSTIPLQHLSYEKQRIFKSKIVRDSFFKHDIFKEVTILETIEAKEPWHYRNKTQVPVRLHNGKMETGVFSNNSHRLIPVTDFKINLPGIDEVVTGVKNILMEFNEKPYDERTHTGNIRHIIVRKGFHTEQMMVIIITRSKSLFPKSKIIPAIIEKFPNVVSIIHNINNKKSSAIFGESSEVIHGEPSFKEEILGKTFDVTARSFLQVNTKQAEVLYTKAIELLDLQGDEVVLDAYCGIGTISLNLADKAKQVIGIEVMPEAVEIAKTNAINNNIENVSFECGLVEDVVDNLKTSPDVVVVDPPRKGLETSFIEYLIKLNPKKIAYISCNPTTLVRDVKQFVEAGYSLSDVQPVDMFPQTCHIESIVKLSRK
ncbi:MAG: 23S rRNA (uracil(1939)-C(5))-methyltransferase RlmD [Coprobacillaceae bacterium]